MIQWAKFGSKVMKASKKFGKTKAGKKITKAKMAAATGLKKADKAFGAAIFKGIEGASKAKSAIKSTGTYKDIRKLSKATPITFGQGATAFAAGAGAGAIFKKSQGYEFTKKKKNGK